MYETRDLMEYPSSPRQLRAELVFIEEQLDRLNHENKLLSEDLGRMYYQFRQSQRGYDAGREARLEPIVRVSRVADDNLDRRYWLEYRKRRILRSLEEMEG